MTPNNSTGRLAPLRRLRAPLTLAALATLLALHASPASGAPTTTTVFPLSQGFEGSSGPFTYSGNNCDTCWQPVMTQAHNGFWAIYAPDSDVVSDSRLSLTQSLAIPAEATAARLTFWQRYDFEYNDAFDFDGGVFEISTDDGMNWADGGADITAGGYTGTIDLNDNTNPLTGRSGWTRTSVDWQQVTVDLMPYRGRSYRFRFRLGTDQSNFRAFDGWRIDDVEVTYQVPRTACERYWAAASSYPLGVAGPAAVAHGGTLYVFAGLGENGAVADAHRYSEQSDEWTPIADLPEPRYAASAVSDGRYIYILGGSNGGDGTKTMWRYDPTTDTYDPMASFTVATVEQAAVYLDGIIYRIAGREDYLHEKYTKSVETYAVATNSWTTVAEHPTAVANLAAMTRGGYIYTAGGETLRSPEAKTFRFDPASGVWDDGPIADLPTRAPAVGALYKDIWILIARDFAYGWDPASNAWRSLDELPQRVHGAGAAATADTFYLISGSSLIDSAQIYVENACPAMCAGDCDGNRTVGVAELVRGVGIALGSQAVAECPSFDSNRDGGVGVNELVAAVNNALNGCP